MTKDELSPFLCKISALRLYEDGSIGVLLPELSLPRSGVSWLSGERWSGIAGERGSVVIGDSGEISATLTEGDGWQSDSAALREDEE